MRDFLLFDIKNIIETELLNSKCRGTCFSEIRKQVLAIHSDDLIRKAIFFYFDWFWDNHTKDFYIQHKKKS